MLYEQLWKHVDNTCTKCASIVAYEEAIISSCCNRVYHNQCNSLTDRCVSCSNYYRPSDKKAILAMFATEANIASVISVYKTLELQEVKQLDKELKLDSTYCYRMLYYPTKQDTEPFDAWSYGIFRGFNWSNFTVNVTGIEDFQTDIGFILWTPYYPEMRARLKYFYEFIGERLHISADSIVSAVNSNLLTLLVPGFIRRITVFIVYRNLMEADIPGYQRLMQNDIIYTSHSLPVPVFPPPVHQPLPIKYSETPEEYFRRTGEGVTITHILNYIFPSWTLEFEIGRRDYNAISTVNSIVKKYDKHVNFHVSRSLYDTTRINLCSPHRKARFKAPLTAKKIMEFVYTVVYSQRTVQK